VAVAVTVVVTFSGSKGGTGKTTISVSLSLLCSARVNTLLVDASAEGGATSYLLGDCPGPYLSQDPARSLRKIAIDEADVRLAVAVNRGPLLNPELVARHIAEWGRSFQLTLIDLPALTDFDAIKRYMPFFELADTVLVVTEPSPASLEASLYTFGPKRVIIALNQPRPYVKSVVEHYRRVVEWFCKQHGYNYVVVPYDAAMARLTPSSLRVIMYTSDEYDAALVKLAQLLLRK